jgi:hypothetical protein
MTLRDKLVSIALEWQRTYGNAPAITGTLGEYDAAMLVGCTEEDYQTQMRERSVVARGHDFVHAGSRYQVRANRPSGRRGSPVTLVSKPDSYEWDFFVWVHYHTDFRLREAWLWPVAEFRTQLGSVSRLSPSHVRQGERLFGDDRAA